MGAVSRPLFVRFRTEAFAILLAAMVVGACATPRTQCPLGTNLARRIYSGGAESEWCRRGDGVRQGPETRYYESGRELAVGEYVDGALAGVWRYRFKDGHNWRADRWDDGALIAKTVDPRVTTMTPEALQALGWTTSGIIKLTSHDPLLGRAAREAVMTTFVAHHPSGRPRIAGSYDADGLRTGVWRFWYADGRLALLAQLRRGGMSLKEALAEVERSAGSANDVGPAGFEPAAYGLKVRSSTD